jgi:hypothetical protein
MYKSPLFVSVLIELKRKRTERELRLLGMRSLVTSSENATSMPEDGLYLSQKSPKFSCSKNVFQTLRTVSQEFESPKELLKKFTHEHPIHTEHYNDHEHPL